MPKKIKANKEDLIQEYINLYNQYGNLTVRKYVEKSKYNNKYITVFGSYPNLRREALTGSSEQAEHVEDEYLSLFDKPKNIKIEIESKPEHFQILVLGDMHVPFHDKAVLKKVVKLIQDIKPKVLILNGDFLDLFILGSYSENSLKDLRTFKLDYEYEEGNKVLDMLDNVLPENCEKIYLYGNHENRYFRHQKKGDNDKYGDALLSPHRALRLQERGYKYLLDYTQDFILLGDVLEFHHGVYANKYFVAKHLTHSTRNVIVSHIHTMQAFTDPAGREGYSLGFLGDLNYKMFNYAMRTSKLRWKQGFIIVDFEKSTQNFWVNMVRCKEKKFAYNGKLY